MPPIIWAHAALDVSHRGQLGVQEADERADASKARGHSGAAPTRNNAPARPRRSDKRLFLGVGLPQLLDDLTSFLFLPPNSPAGFQLGGPANVSVPDHQLAPRVFPPDEAGLG